MTVGRLGQDFGERRVSKRRFDRRQGVVHSSVQRTESHPVSLQSQGALPNAGDRLNRIDDIENRQLGW